MSLIVPNQSQSKFLRKDTFWLSNCLKTIRIKPKVQILAQEQLRHQIRKTRVWSGIYGIFSMEWWIVLHQESSWAKKTVNHHQKTSESVLSLNLSWISWGEPNFNPRYRQHNSIFWPDSNCIRSVLSESLSQKLIFSKFGLKNFQSRFHHEKHTLSKLKRPKLKNSPNWVFATQFQPV